MTWWEWLLVVLVLVIAGLVYLANWFAKDLEHPK